MPALNFDLTTNNEDKALSKRCPTSAVMQMQIDLPGEQTLVDGVHTIGFLEGNIAITKVALIIKEVFDGTTPAVTITDTQNGVEETWLTAAVLSSLVVQESDLTAPTVAGKEAPFYRGTKSEWKANIALGGSTVGELALLVDYVQLDTEPGKHS